MQQRRGALQIAGVFPEKFIVLLLLVNADPRSLCNASGDGGNSTRKRSGVLVFFVTHSATSREKARSCGLAPKAWDQRAYVRPKARQWIRRVVDLETIVLTVAVDSICRRESPSTVVAPGLRRAFVKRNVLIRYPLLQGRRPLKQCFDERL
jgi:hypothetical protein